VNISSGFCRLGFPPDQYQQPDDGPQFEQTGTRIGYTFHDAQVKPVATQHREQEMGQQREYHLAGDVEP